MSEKYQLEFKPQQEESGDFCIYQTNDSQSEDIRSLVWFSKRAHPETKLKYEWDIEYGFLWGDQGTLVPGVVFGANQHVPVDLLTGFEIANENENCDNTNCVDVSKNGPEK